MHGSQRRLCQKIGESLSFPKLYYLMPINMFFIVKNHWEPSFTDNLRISLMDPFFSFKKLLSLTWVAQANPVASQKTPYLVYLHPLCRRNIGLGIH
jgi:hypothetical protein